MNSGTGAALRRLGLALAVGSIAAGGAFAASDLGGSATGADEPVTAAQGPGAANDGMGAGHAPGRHDGEADRDGFGPGRVGGWHHGGGDWHHGWQRHGFRGHGMMMDRGFLAAVRQLDLTPVQREQMRSIVLNAREAVRMERAQEEQSGAAQHRRDDFAVLSNPGDPNYAHVVQQLKSRAAERVQQAIGRASDTEQKLYNVLTAEQKAQLPKVLAEQRSRRQQRMQEMHRRHEGMPGGPPEAPPPSNQ